MKCPNCKNLLEVSTHKGLEVEICPSCGGMWFDFHELDKLEDSVLPHDDLKGTLVWDKKETDKECPKCSKRMTGFNYRLNGLHLEYCSDMHGYWLDKGEEERVLIEMEKEANKLERKFDVEEKWTKSLRELQSPSIFEKIIGLFR